VKKAVIIENSKRTSFLYRVANTKLVCFEFKFRKIDTYK
jgi:hypothetical protein